MSKVEKITGGAFDLRVTRRKARQISSRRTQSARVRVKCGCCSNVLDIHHDEESLSAVANTLEINGVMGTVEQWRQILLPLLNLEETIGTKGQPIWKSVF